MSAMRFLRASSSVLRDLTSSARTPLSRLRVSLAILRRSASLEILTISLARALLSRSAFSYRLVISFSLVARSALDLSEFWNLEVISLTTTWLCSKSLMRTLTSPVSLALAFSAALSFCSRVWQASVRPLTSMVIFFLRASVSSTRRRFSFSYFFFQSAFSACHLAIDPSRVTFRERSSSISTVRVLMVRSRPWILVLAALTFLASLSAARRSSSSWVANLFLSRPACSRDNFISFSFLAESWASIWSLCLALVMSATLLLRSPIFTLYSLTVISSFSTTFLMETFSLSRDSLSICSCSSIIEVWCLVLRVWICCSDSLCTSSSSFLSLLISASLFLLISSWLSEPDSDSVSLSDREMICIWSCCFSCSILLLRPISDSRSSWRTRICSSYLLMADDSMLEDPETWTSVLVVTLPSASVL